MTTNNWELAAPSTWTEQAAEGLRKAALLADTFHFTAEELRLGDHGVPVPYDDRAWEPAVRMAISRGYIAHTDLFAPAASSHGSPKPVYRLGPNA